MTRGPETSRDSTLRHLRRGARLFGEEKVIRGNTPVAACIIDLYSLYGSMAAVLRCLDKVDPTAAKRSPYSYLCFDQFGEDTQAYGYAASFGMTGPAKANWSTSSMSCNVTQSAGSCRWRRAANPRTQESRCCATSKSGNACNRLEQQRHRWRCRDHGPNGSTGRRPESASTATAVKSFSALSRLVI